MRADNFKIFLIALVSNFTALLYKKTIHQNLLLQEKAVGDVMSVIDLQGQLDRQYVVGFFYSPLPQRSTLRLRWPHSVEDNIERLGNAGLPYDRKVPKCNNCGGKYILTRWESSC